MKTATLALIVQNGKVLLGEKKRGEIGTGTLNGPGGKQEPGESLLECLIRETEEELGITLSPGALEEVAVITFHAGTDPDFKVHIYKTDTFEGSLRETMDMIPSWHDTANLPFGRMLDSDRAWFEKALAGEKFCANVFYRERAHGFEKIEFLPYE